MLGLYEPCPEEWMTMENPRYTICEVLRGIYQETNNPAIKLKSRVAMTMAKKMNDRLISLNDKITEEWDGKTDEMRKKLK